MNRRTTVKLLLFVPLFLLGAAAFAACERHNDIVAQEQIRDSLADCPKGCEVPPPGCAVKGNISAQGNKFYHVPGGYYYNGVVIEPEKGERWFCSEAEAVANGWVKSIR